MMENEPLQPIESGISNIITIVLGATVLGLLVFGGYIYQTKQIIPKEKEISFQQLPQKLQDNYISKEDMLDLEKELSVTKAEVSQLKEQLENEKIRKELSISSITPEQLETKVEIKEKVIEKVVKLTDSIDKTNYKTFTCKSFEAGGIVIPSSCKQELFSFLETNKDAKLLEIIGLVDNMEFRLIKNLEEVYGKQKIKDIKKYVQRGLSRQRVVEMTWLIKEFSNKKKKNFNLNAVNYTLYSKNKRGFVIKAYY